MWLLGFITGVFLMVVDELINLSLYCGLKCNYAIPLLGPLDIWDSWALTFIVIVGTIFLSLLIISGEKRRVA